MMKSSKSLFTILVMAFVVLALTSVAFAQSGAAVEPIIVLSNTQAEDPIEFETTRLLVENMRQLGLQVEHKAVPWAQYSIQSGSSVSKPRKLPVAQAGR